ncbi:MAG TPA: glucose 1-dehydrogenase [Trebonia sp.]|jgi:NAD(P)-dependent dehydrogenase (short-subunit alcohol dehydrogenase family)|nr:glucose 1-dehydrogenase [Trebonia sp.]
MIRAHSGPGAASGLLDGEVAIVTGASRGIGLGIARGLRAAGARVGLIARHAEALEAAASELAGQPGPDVACADADVADSDALTAAVARLQADLGDVTVLVNNAGVIDRTPSDGLSSQAWRRVFATNLDAAFAAARAAAPSMRAAGGGAVVNVTSLSAHFGVRRAASYGASKSGLLGLTRALALEWAADGIRVNAVTPGYIDTDFTGPLTGDPERSQRILERIPLGRWGKPADVAGTVVYLASPLAAYVTGQVLVVDGGYSIDG